MNKTRLQQLALGFLIVLIVVMTYSMMEDDVDEPSLTHLVATNGLELPSQLDNDTVASHSTIPSSSVGTPSGINPSLQDSQVPIKQAIAVIGNEEVDQYLALLKDHKLESLKAQIAQSKASQAEAAKVVKEVKEKNQPDQNQLVFNPMPLPDTPTIETPIISEEPDVELIMKSSYDFKLIYLRVINDDIKGFISINDKLYEAWPDRKINEDITINEVNSHGLLLTVRGQSYSLRPGSIITSPPSPPPRRIETVTPVELQPQDDVDTSL